MKGNRLTAYEAGVLQLAEELEHHSLHRTGSMKAKGRELIQFVRNHKREDRRQAAKEARA